MKTEYRNAAAAKQKLHRAWASEPEIDTDGQDYTLTPTDEHEQCTRCGAAGHTMNNCPWPKGD